MRRGWFVDGELGMGSLSGSASCGETDVYWVEVMERLKGFVERLAEDIEVEWVGIEKLVLVGEHALDQGFIRVVKRVLGGVFEKAWVETLMEGMMDPLYVVAMGAAVLTKDYLDAPKPLGCTEDRRCEDVKKGLYVEEVESKSEWRGWWRREL